MHGYPYLTLFFLLESITYNPEAHMILYRSSVKEKVMVMVMVFNATFNNISAISWWSVLLVEKTGEHGENHRPVASD